MFNKNRKAKSIAFALSAILVFSIINTNVFAKGVEVTPQKITQFAPLPADIALQNIYVGDAENKIKLPTTLSVTFEKNVIPEQNTVETPVEQSPVVQPPMETPQVEQPPVETPEPATTEIPAESQVQPPAETPVDAVTTDNNVPAVESTAIGDQGRSIIDYIMPSITVYAAEPGNTKGYSVINGITWRIDPKLSTSAAFSSAVAGAKFVYVPVIPVNYSVAVAVPQIVVNVIAKAQAPVTQENISNVPNTTPQVQPKTENAGKETKEDKQKNEAEVKEIKEEKAGKTDKVTNTEQEDKKEDKNKDKEDKSEDKSKDKSEDKTGKEDKTENNISDKNQKDEKSIKSDEEIKEDKEEKTEKEIKEDKEDKSENDIKEDKADKDVKDEEKTDNKDTDDKDKKDKIEEEINKDSQDKADQDEIKEDKEEKEDKESKDGKKDKEDKDNKNDKEVQKAFSYEQTLSGYTVSINAPAGVFPEGTTVSIKVVSNPLDLIEDRLSFQRNIAEIVTFSISFMYEGKEIEPKDGNVEVSITLADDMKETLKDESARLQVFHVNDTDSIEEVKCSTDGEEVTFSAESFSEYTLVTTTGTAKTKLDVPTNVHWVDGEALTLAWNTVSNADEYGIYLTIEGETGWISTSSKKNQINLVEIVSSQESYYQKFFSGKKVIVKVRAEINGSDKQKAQKYQTGDYSDTVSKIYSREVSIDTQNGARIIETDAIFDLMRRSLSADQTTAAAGKQLVFEFSVSDLASTSDGAVAISKYISSKAYKLGKYFDLNVTAKADGTNIGVITQTPSEVPIVVDIPAQLQKSGRTFIVIRNHNGTIAEVGRGTGNKVQIKTNQFSAFGIAYYDPSNSSSNSSNENNNSNNNSSDSSNNGEDARIKALIEQYTWKPTTPDEKWRASVVGKEVYKPYVDPTSGYTMQIKNVMQGPKCFAAFYVALDGYSIARTYDILPNGYKLRATDREVTFSLNIPWTLRKAGRDFRLICVTTNGQPVVLKDLDLNPETITVKTNKFYAFALVYKDTLPVK